jgi:hypothetical protein
MKTETSNNSQSKAINYDKLLDSPAVKEHLEKGWNLLKKAKNLDSILPNK